MYLCVCVFICVYVFVCMYVCMYVFAYIKLPPLIWYKLHCIFDPHLGYTYITDINWKGGRRKTEGIWNKGRYKYRFQKKSDNPDKQEPPLMVQFRFILWRTAQIILKRWNLHKRILVYEIQSDHNPCPKNFVWLIVGEEYRLPVGRQKLYKIWNEYYTDSILAPIVFRKFSALRL